jgi:rhamnulokinase
MTAFAAVDLGASSGRITLARVEAGRVELREVHRFANRPVRVRGTLYWDALTLWAGILDGLRQATRTGPVDGVGVDSWAVDYALLDEDGALLGNPVHYRDARTDGMAGRVGELIGAADLFARTGLQPLPFNTIYQLASARDTRALRDAATALLIPDLVCYWLTGRLASELTNASTTGLVGVGEQRWDRGLFDLVGARGDLFPPIQPPGTVLGPVSAPVTAECDVAATVTLVGSHDTASAVVGVPARSERFGYLSCGTWSLVGTELPTPVLREAALAAGFTNEVGVDGTVRFLRNVMGLWLLQQSMQVWEREGARIELPALLAEAAEVPGRRSVIDPDRPEFLPPGDMPARIRAECRRTDQPVPYTPAEITRCILDSLAAAYRSTLRRAVELTGRDVDVLHVVGGGAQNALLCQLTADACEVPVVAGPVEAAAYGNVLVQARAAGVVSGGLDELRAMIGTESTIRYEPRPLARPVGRG